MKTMQKLRDRPNGVNIVSLALGEKLSHEEEKLMVNKFSNYLFIVFLFLLNFSHFVEL